MSDAKATPPPLWPQPIPIIGGTGKKWSGKSVFGLNICPQPNATLVYDFEQSTTSYEQERARIGAPFVRIDVQKEMHNYKDEKGNYPYRSGYKPINLFMWWIKHVRSLEAGKYRVIMADPVTDLERGLTDWVAANPEYFGHTANQYQKMSGVMWGDVKDFEKIVLADITARCETFYFTAHIGAEFKGNTATGKEKAKGKETLYELASVYLWFERDPDSTGTRPNIPSARVEKGRLMVSELIDEEVVSYSVLPPRLPQATPKAIREYFKNPAGKVALKDTEKAREESMSADDRLRLEVAKAEAERDAAQARATVPQTQQVMVAVTLGARATEFERSIRAATDPAFLLDTVGPQIKLAFDAKEITEPEVNYLRTVFNECGKKLQAQKQSAA